MAFDMSGVNRPSEGEGRLSLLDEVRFWAQVLLDSRRTVLCSPENESRARSVIDAYGVGGVITVKASCYVPDDRFYIVDTSTLETEKRRAVEELRGGQL